MNPFAPPGVEEDECVADSRAVGPKLCPRCGAGIGFARVYFALGPHHVRCGACRAHLGYDELQGPGVLLLLGIAVLGGAIWWGYESIALDPLESIGRTPDSLPSAVHPNLSTIRHDPVAGTIVGLVGELTQQLEVEGDDDARCRG